MRRHLVNRSICRRSRHRRRNAAGSGCSPRIGSITGRIPRLRRRGATLMRCNEPASGLAGIDPYQIPLGSFHSLWARKSAWGQPWNGSESASVPRTAPAPISRITKRTPGRSLGRRRGRCSTACRAAGSTSRTRRSTAICGPGAATSWRCAGSGATDRIRDFSYAALAAAVNRFANVLAQRGIAKGDRVFSLLGRTPELYIAALGTLKNGSVFSPLFSAFGPEPIKARMTIGSAKALITSEAFYRRKIEPWRKELAEPRARLPDRLLRQPAARHDRPGRRHGGASDSFETVRTGPEDMALLHFTSGTTGRPKGAVHVHEAVVAHHITGRLALDLQSGRRLLVHGRPGMGDRHVLRHHLAADQRRDADRRPGRVRCRTLVPHPAGPESHGLVHGADRDPDADEGGRRDRQAVRPVQAALHGERRRAAQSGSRGLGRRGVRQAVPRQLVADRDRRHHDLQLPVDGREARLDGPPAAGHRGRHRRARRSGRSAGDHASRWPSASLRCGRAGRR